MALISKNSPAFSASWCPIERAAQIIGDRWSLLILRELSLGPQRFKALKQSITDISMDQLSRKLEHLCDADMIVRQEFSEAPPRVEYQLTEFGLSFMPVLKRMIVWSLQSLWGSPKAHERTDVALSLRLMASFMGQAEGLVLIRIFNKPPNFDSYLVHRSAQGGVRVQHLKQPQLAVNLAPDVQIDLAEKDWIELLSAKPDQITAVKINVTGNRAVLNNLLPVFSRPGIHEGPDGDRENHAISGEHPVRASL